MKWKGLVTFLTFTDKEADSDNPGRQKGIDFFYLSLYLYLHLSIYSVREREREIDVCMCVPKERGGGGGEREKGRGKRTSNINNVIIITLYFCYRHSDCVRRCVRKREGVEGGRGGGGRSPSP